jgi:tetraacyldisaccharide 4'-kinase
MQFYNRFPQVSVAVGEERIVAIPQLLHDRPETELIILDDAFQHRSVKAGMNIILSDYNNLYTRDWFLPTGDLRDEKSSYKRADILVVTKCRPDLSVEEMEEIREELRPLEHQQVFFSTIEYGAPYHIITKHPFALTEDVEVLLVSGIANPRPLKKYLVDNSGTYYEILYNDHHIFTIDDWKEIQKRFHSIQSADKIILTTEKDAVRLMKFEQSMRNLPVYAIPIQVKFLFGGEHAFIDSITQFILQFRQKNQLIDG